jgi:hypothetical protein
MEKSFLLKSVFVLNFSYDSCEIHGADYERPAGGVDMGVGLGNIVVTFGIMVIGE